MLKRLLRGPYYRVRAGLTRAQGVLWDRSMVPVGGLGLDLGCGPKKRHGFVGLDRWAGPAVDVVCDFEEASLPFADETFVIVHANHVLEHVRRLEELLAEVARVLRPGGVFQVGVPYAGSLRAFQDPTHVRYFTLKSFEYFVREGARVGGWYMEKPFRRIRRRSLVFRARPLPLLTSVFVNRGLRLLDAYEASILRSIPAEDLLVELEK